MFKDGEERTVETAVANIIDAVDMTNFSDEIEVIRGALADNTGRNARNEDTIWKEKYDALYEQYTKRFKETFVEPFSRDPAGLDPDVHNMDTTFTEKDILRFDFSGKNE